MTERDRYGRVLIRRRSRQHFNAATAAGGLIMSSRKSLTDILEGVSRDELARQFEAVEAAPDYTPLPRGSYKAEVSSGELTTSASGTPGYTLGFTVCEGELKGRRLWHTLWLTQAAMPMTKRDLAKLGVVRLEQLEKPMPLGIICQLSVVVRTDDDGETRNRVSRMDVIEIRPDATADEDFSEQVVSEVEGGAA
jgi:hypothetical protein